MSAQVLTDAARLLLTRAPGKPWSLLEAAQFIGICEKTLCRRIKANEVRVIRLGARVLVPDAEVRRLSGQE
jgi:hypothetical protein